MTGQLTSRPTSRPTRPAQVHVTQRAASDSAVSPSEEDVWQEARRAWLFAKQGRSGSPHTTRAYEHDWDQFFEFVRKAPWEITSRDADAWLHHLRTAGAAESSISRKMGAMSSFYQYVIDHYGVIGASNMGRGLYADAHGGVRANPFRRSERPKVLQFSSSQPVAIDALRCALKKIKVKSL